jgi:DNA-directed RNA polymerase subunit beta
MRPGDPPTLESAKALFEGMFFDARKYDFSRVGRFKFNIKLDLQSPVTQKTMTPEDFYVVINYLLRLARTSAASTTSTTSATAASARSGELLENQFRIGLVRMERAIKEKMSVHQDIDSGDAARPDQLQARHRGDQGVLRLVAALAVHGPDESALRSHAQAPLSALGPGGLSR